MRSVSLFVALVLLAACPLFAGYAARDLYVPIAGRVIAHDGRGFFTTLWVTNVTEDPADVELNFLRSAQLNPAPGSFKLRLAPNETRVLPIEEITGVAEASGAVRIRSGVDVTATARVYGRMQNETDARSIGAAFNAIPARLAIGNGETARIQGVTDGSREKLYAVETTGQPLYFALALLDAAGKVVAEKHMYLGPREHRGWELDAEFPNARGAVVARLHGVNGSGKVIAAIAQIAAETQDTTAFEMTLPTEPRHRIRNAELAAYILVAFAIGWSIVTGRRRTLRDAE